MKKIKEKVLAVIPARGGSRSIPKKNIKLFCGHPLIAYSIAAALQSKICDRVIVTTDCQRIAEIARSYGAEVPFLRPKGLARDDVGDLPVFKHALKWLREHQNYTPGIIVQLRPTSPFRPKGFVDQGIRLLHHTPAADSLRAVTASPKTPYKMWQINRNFLKPIIGSNLKEPYNANRQALPDTFWQTGQLDITRLKTILGKNSMTGNRIIPLMVPIDFAVDLDTLSDWEFAEWTGIGKKLDIVRPDHKQDIFGDIRMAIFDFDGVFTDNQVYLTDDGKESVACSRADGMGLSLLKKHGIKIAVISGEVNPVVSARCKKLKLMHYQGVRDKVPLFKKILSQEGLKNNQTLFVGNDLNDLGCMNYAKLGVAVANAHPQVLREADLVLEKSGGQGAIRELCDLIISRRRK